MKLYLVGIKFYQLDLETDCTVFSDLQLERTLQGIKHDYCESARHTRTPLKRLQLFRMLKYLQSNDYNDTVIRAAFTLAFAGFLRIEEFTYRAVDLQIGPVFSN